MALGKLEHVNITVTDAMKTAERLNSIFGWEIRWQGASTDGNGYTVHIGTEDDYIAVYSWDKTVDVEVAKYAQRGGMNHVGVVVDDLEAAEARVRAAGCEPHAHFDYEPGRRFYFADPDGVEWEVVSYN